MMVRHRIWQGCHHKGCPLPSVPLRGLICHYQSHAIIMSIPSNTFPVSIDGKRLARFKPSWLVQRIGEHHRFELVIDLETGYNRYVHNLKDNASWLGKTLALWRL